MFTGRPAYYVVVECGRKCKEAKFQRSNFFWYFLHVPPQSYHALTILVTEFVGAGNHKKICWNEKFVVEFPPSKWEKLTHVKLNVMDEEYFSDDGFAGETT